MGKKIVLLGVDDKLGESLIEILGKENKIIPIFRDNDEVEIFSSIMHEDIEEPCFWSISNPYSFEDVLNEIVEKEGKIDVFINNVGGFKPENTNRLADYINQDLKRSYGSVIPEILRGCICDYMRSTSNFLTLNIRSRYYTQKEFSLVANSSENAVSFADILLAGSLDDQHLHNVKTRKCYFEDLPLGSHSLKNDNDVKIIIEEEANYIKNVIDEFFKQ